MHGKVSRLRIIVIIIIVIVCLCKLAPAERCVSQSGKSAKQQMKECVARTRASNTALTESDARKACHEAMKAQKDSPHEEKPQ
jgi:Sec-independent protein translocase protein TatA